MISELELKKYIKNSIQSRTEFQVVQNHAIEADSLK